MATRHRKWRNTKYGKRLISPIPAARYHRDWKKALYNQSRSRHMRNKWKDPKAGLRRKRYYVSKNI